MIRKNLLLCKIFRLKTSSKSLFDSYMAKFQPELETCPICGSTGNCHIHDYYGRSIIDFRDGKRQKSDLCVMRVFCDSCEHAHAILPDIIIPYPLALCHTILRNCHQNAESLRRVPIRHNRGGNNAEIKMQFAPPTMCRLTS